jgi:hypothetical protein
MTEDSDLDFLATCLVTALKEKRHTVVPKLFKMYEEFRENEQYSNFIGSDFYSPTLEDSLDFSYGDDRLSVEYSPEMT